MKILKYIWFFTVLSIILIIFSGCTKDSPIVPNKTKSTPPTNIVKFAYWLPSNKNTIERLIEQYNSSNTDHIRIDVVKIPQDKYNQIMNMLISSNENIDIFSLSSEMTDTYIYKNWLIDLSLYLDRDFLKQFPDWAVKFARDPAYKGSFYTLPSGVITFRLIYNKDLFRKAGLDPYRQPQTIHELVVIAKKISDAGKGDRKYGFAVPANDEWFGFVQSMEAPLSFSGIYFYDFLTGKYCLDVYKSWFQAIDQMRAEESLFPAETFLSVETALAQFAEGNIGMMFVSSWTPAWLANYYPPKCNWGVAMPPAVDEQSIGKGAVIAYPDGCFAINVSTENIDCSLKVWKFLYSKEFQTSLFSNGLAFPIIHSIEPRLIGAIENLDQFYPSNKDAPYPNIPKVVDNWDRMKVYFSIITGRHDAEAALQNQSYIFNSVLDSAILHKRINVSDYANSQYDPLYPTKDK